MVRPKNLRKISSIPEVTYFKPAGIPLRALGEVRLSVEEIEALRLRDIEALEQEQCAEKMGISRSTFQRVLGSARQKVADALLGGKAIRIGGGSYRLAGQRLPCCGVPEKGQMEVQPMTPGEQKGRPCRGGRMKGARAGAGPVGNCVCPGCGIRTLHQRGVPCIEVSCPSCGAKMTRD